jgi:hypothetical protein
LPAEPGRLVVNALLIRARRERGCATPGDDRFETRAYAVKRYLFRLGHAQRSGRYATSIAQLVAGLAPVIGWGTVLRDSAERARFVRAHRRCVQRWLDDLQMAGLVTHEPERDADGKWWRPQLLPGDRSSAPAGRSSRQGPRTVIEPEREGAIDSTTGRIMVKAVVLYGPPEDPDAFKRSAVPPRF